MGMTLVQKVLARASGRAAVNVGEIVIAEPDVFELIDLEMPHFCKILAEEGVVRLKYPERCVVFADHEVPSQSEAVAKVIKPLKSQMQRLGIDHYYIEGRHGISHQAIVEKGHVAPGMLAIGPDTHITTLGCVGAVGVPIQYETVQALATGDIWLKVPETIRVNLFGNLRPGVMSRDLAQQLAAFIGREQADYRVIEFQAPTLDMDARMTLCNVMVDIGAKSAVVEPDQVTRSYIAKRRRGDVDVVISDSDARFAREFDYDMAQVELMIAAPPRPDNLVPLATVAGKRVDRVYIGSCAGGRLEDLRSAAAILKGREIHAAVRMFIVPTTQEVFAAAAREGLLSVFAEAGAVVMAPTCGPCYGNTAPLVDGDVCIGTGTSNVPGRMGSPSAEIYLANAAVSAAAAVSGCIIDPAEL